MIALILFAFCIQTSSAESLKQRTDLMSFPRDYYSSIAPPTLTTVAMSFNVLDVMEIDDYSHLLELKAWVKVQWSDSRIKFNTSNAKEIVHLNLPEARNSIWFPQLDVYNLDSFKSMNGAFHKDEKLLILGGKNFCLESQISVKIYCPMEFDSFPFDTHFCHFQVGSRISNSTVSLGLDKLHGLENGTTFSEYSIHLSHLPELKKQIVKREMHSFPYQIHDITGFTLILSRNPRSYLINYFFPSGLFVVVSWMSLVIPPDSIPSRIALIFTTFIVLVNISISISALSPLSTKKNSIQLWVLVCIVFVACTVIEYSIILILQRKVKKEQLEAKLKILRSNVCMMRSRNAIVGATENALNIVLTYADFIGFIILFISFTLFNICFWSVVMTN